MHAHSSLENLIKQAERKAETRERKDFRPGWLKEFIFDSADLFEPLTETARVGYDCRFHEDRWLILFYLGDAEIFGGKHDGRRTRIPFHFNMQELLAKFDRVESIMFRTINDDIGLSIEDGDMIEVTGHLKESDSDDSIIVGILSRPPKEAGPGMKMSPAGDMEPA